MWDIPKLYNSACSNSVQLLPLHPIIMSILFHHYRELKECVREVEEIREGKVNNDNHNDYHSSSNGGIIVMMTEQEILLETYDDMVQEMEEEIIMHEDMEIIEETPGTLDGYFRIAADNKGIQRDSVLD